jgi:aspartyl-tRNA(Asn)/glutamyl-tRNA(Gln) amidotransferase subunit A
MTVEIAFASIAELGAKLRAKTLTSLALTEIYLERIAQLQPKLNAFVTVTADLARTQAKQADQDLTDGRDRGPLHGIPYAVKDLVDTAGIPTTWGCKAMLDRVPKRDAALVERLREAGAVLLGKLQLTELANALGVAKTSWNHGGPSRNPWDLTRWSGGSSAGSGSATAAGLCAFAIGSETWGSIDCPAAFCGVTGFRPTFGVVDRRGALLICPTLDKLGPLARSAADVTVVLDQLATQPLEPVGGFRIGVVTPPQGPPGYARAFADALHTLRGAGVTLAQAELPKSPGEITTAVFLFTEIMGALSELIASGAVNRLYDQQPWDAKWSAYLALGIRGDDYVKATYVRAHVQREYQALFDKFDILLTAGRPYVATVIDGPWAETPGGNYDVLNGVGNLIGVPAITLPIGFSEGLPISLHAIAAPYHDRTLAAFGELFQQRTDFHRRRPTVH